MPLTRVVVAVMINGKIHPALKVCSQRIKKGHRVKIGILLVASDYIAVAITAAVSYKVLQLLKTTGKLRNLKWLSASDVSTVGTVFGSSPSEVRSLPLRAAETPRGCIVFAPEGHFAAFEISVIVAVNEPVASVCEWCGQSHWCGGTSCHQCILADASDLRRNDCTQLYPGGRVPNNWIGR